MAWAIISVMFLEYQPFLDRLSLNHLLLDAVKCDYCALAFKALSPHENIKI